jgi:hypothetical protein
MAVLYTPHFIQFFDDNGDPLASGKLYTYAAGTTTPKATYTTAAATVANPNPIVLDSAGRAVAFLDGSYKFRLETAASVLVRETDNVSAFTTSAVTIDSILPAQSGNANKILGTDGATSSWVPATAPTASQLLGRGTTGGLSAITLGTGLSMSGTTLNGTAGPFTKEFTQTGITLVSSSNLGPYAHGLGTKPKMIGLELVCVTSELGYSSGDSVYWSSYTDSANSQGTVVYADSTNIRMRTSSNSSAVDLLNATFGTSGLSYANWTLTIRAWA